MNRTKINAKANREIKKICQKNDWRFCQINLDGCAGEAHAPAHRHKRVWYYDKPDYLLWDVGQWLPACQNCHVKIESDKELTEKIFFEKRGDE